MKIEEGQIYAPEFCEYFSELVREVGEIAPGAELSSEVLKRDLERKFEGEKKEGGGGESELDILNEKMDRVEEEYERKRMGWSVGA